MTERPALTEALARVLCEAWFEVCELPTRWPQASMDQRDTFRAMTQAALAAARAGRKAEDQIAEALCVGFWLGTPQPRPWAAHGQQQRAVFRRCAGAFIAAARELRAQHQAERQSAEPQAVAA